jgi:hypothetical protein
MPTREAVKRKRDDGNACLEKAIQTGSRKAFELGWVVDSK